jgi:hypothetical protein
LWPLQVPHPLIEKNSLFQVILRVPHASADLATRLRRRHRPDRRLYYISGRAEACLTADVLVWSLIPLSLEQLPLPFPQIAAPICSFSDCVTTRTRPRQPTLQNNAAREAVQDRFPSQLKALLFRMGTRSVQASLSMPQVRADSATWCQRARRTNNCSYQVERHACTFQIIHAYDYFPIPQSIEQSLQTFPPSTAPTRGFSQSDPTCPQYKWALVQIVALCGNMHSHSCPQSLVLFLRAEISSVQVSFRALHTRAALAVWLRHAPSPDSRLYQVRQHAKTCTVACAPDWNPSPVCLVLRNLSLGR